MRLAGIHKNSFVDYPGHIAAVIFTQGCNMNCWYCHNRHILDNSGETADEKNVFAFLNERKNFLDGVVLTGGEPLMQDDAIEFLRKLRETGLNVKLDTNGTSPKALEKIMDESLVDCIAMDIKAPFEKYDLITPMANIPAIKKSIKLMMGSGIDYEFRTTFAPNLTAEDIGEIARNIKGAKKYCIQQFKKSEGMRAKIAPEPHGITEIARAEAEAKKYLDNVVVRGAY